MDMNLAIFADMFDTNPAVTVLIPVVAHVFVITMTAVVMTSIRVNVVRMVKTGWTGLVRRITITVAVGKYGNGDDQCSGKYKDTNCQNSLHD
jgi:hypothetical protein